MIMLFKKLNKETSIINFKKGGKNYGKRIDN